MDFFYKLKTFKPITASLRHTCLVDRKKIWKGRSVKGLSVGFPCLFRKSGRIIFRRRAGGHKRSFRYVDFFRQHNLGVPGVVKRIEYDPNRSSFISLVLLKNNIVFYMLTPSNVYLEDSVSSSLYKTFSEVGDSCFLRFMSQGMLLHNLELLPGFGGQLIRSAGTYGLYLRKFIKGNRVVLKFRSGILMVFPLHSFATVGVVSNLNHRAIHLGKAGRSRWLGNRPVVRGVAMNPVDHPHGGGEGKKSNKAVPKSLWGIASKWKRTSRSREFKRSW